MESVTYNHFSPQEYHEFIPQAQREVNKKLFQGVLLVGGIILLGVWLINSRQTTRSSAATRKHAMARTQPSNKQKD
jgi:hypothetical protein